jgi:hypothetical protein
LFDCALPVTMQASDLALSNLGLNLSP